MRRFPVAAEKLSKLGYVTHYELSIKSVRLHIEFA